MADDPKWLALAQAQAEGVKSGDLAVGIRADRRREQRGVGDL
jgi:hypothetical protein